MSTVLEEIERLRSISSDLRSKRFDHKVILALLKSLLSVLAAYLPNAKLEERKNKWICNFGIKGVGLIMVEPVHGSRDAIPQFWRKQMLDTADEVLDLVESVVEGRS
jgi:hypothetical protein